VADALPISGNIDPKTFPFLLMDLHRQGATGSLKVEGPTYQKALYFRSGRILFGSSNDPRDQLGAILIEAGKITPEQLEDVNAKVGPGNPLAKVLADTGFVNQRELSESARAKVERILSDVIAYTTGSFEFEDGVLPKGAIDLKLSTEKVVLAAVRRISDRTFVLRHLDNLEVVLAPRPDKASALAEVQGDTGGLVEQLDGRRTLKEAVGRTRLDDFEAAKVACALLFLGLLGRGAAEPAFRSGGGAELDLGATASAAFAIEEEPGPTLILPDAAPPPKPSSSESPFFVAEPEAEPPIPPPEPVRAAPAPPPAPPRPVTPPPPLIVPEPAETIVLTAPPAPTVPAAPPPPVEPTIRMEPTVAEPPAARSRSAGPALVYPPNAPSRPRPEPPKPSPSRPSKDDLAALDVLLNPKSHQTPMSPLEPGGREDAWGPPDNEAEPRRLPRGVLLGIGLLVLGAVGVAALWYSRENPNAFAFGRSRGPSPSTTLAAIAPPTTIAALPPTTLAPVAPTTTVVAAPARTLAPAPVSIPTPMATPVRPLATPPPATPRPATPVPASSPTGNLLDQARTALRSGNYDQAARAFAAHIRRAPAGTATIQLLVACSTDTVQKAMSEVGSAELFILPVNYKGRDCYRMAWGIYPDAARAASAARSLPDYFRRGGATPRVMPAAEVVP
jgi:hypothetical protein